MLRIAKSSVHNCWTTTNRHDPRLSAICQRSAVGDIKNKLSTMLRIRIVLRALLVLAFFAVNSEGLLKRLHLTKSSRTALSSAPDVDFFNRPGPWDDKDLKSLMNANKMWAKRMAEDQPGFFDEIKKGHAPKILWIGCSDARVPANEVIGEPPGSVFVHRNVANMVLSTDFNCMSVVQYAVDVLKVKHIIVCGHYDCGGVRAALEPVDHHSPLENWLRNIRDTYRLHNDELNAIPVLRDRQRRLVELNVIEQVSDHNDVVKPHIVETTHRCPEQHRSRFCPLLSVPSFNFYSYLCSPCYSA
jgi:carbonic anhydrase